MPIETLILGQSGVRLQLPGGIAYIDPYLSDSVALRYGSEFSRLLPPPFEPSAVVDANWVFITHDHLDHCDPETLVPVAAASNSCQFIGPPTVVGLLQEWGVSAQRLVLAPDHWLVLSKHLRVRAVPAAHPTIARDSSGQLQAVGYVFDVGGRRLYHSGDTAPASELIAVLQELRPSVGFLPVNERNFFRDQKGIIGNMSLREAFQFAGEIGLEVLIPIHWDMFAMNSLFRDEIELLYRLSKPKFQLSLSPTHV
jgi:L-ascorbate 6-phosphate lactonase